MEWKGGRLGARAKRLYHERVSANMHSFTASGENNLFFIALVTHADRLVHWSRIWAHTSYSLVFVMAV